MHIVFILMGVVPIRLDAMGSALLSLLEGNKKVRLFLFTP
jgi:hypothetical protein